MGDALMQVDPEVLVWVWRRMLLAIMVKPA